ncbi:histone acetyltransferase HAC1-like [Rutidosis leptorrhynchoides]|uniref:histone acetyltransferase HAC1-like n=1 Tax=Rutidosis leptorrhynchoides TaxID=125765 RepID=UPI003A992388
MQSSGGSHNTLNVDPSLLKARRFIQERIYEFLMQRQQTQQIGQKKVMEIVRRLEEGLFKIATSKEEYLNLETLETRLHILIKRLPLSNQNQQYQQGNTSVPVGTMIPNPSLTNGYQQSTPNFNNPRGNSLISSMGAQRMASQMIPTPGFNNSNSTSNQTCMNMNSSYSDIRPSTNDSTTVSQSLQQRQEVGGQNSRILHSLGSHMGGSIRSSLHQKANGCPNGSIIDSQIGNSPKTLPQHSNQQISQGNGYVNNAATSLMNNQNMNSVNLHALHKTSSPLMVNQSNLVNSQLASNSKPSIDQAENLDIRSQHSLRESAMQSQQPVHFQQQPVQSQSQLMQQNQVSDHFQADSRDDQFFPDTQNDLDYPIRDQSRSEIQSQNVQGECSQRIDGPDQTQQSAVNTSLDPPNTSATCKSVDPTRELQFKNQQRWLLFLRHAKKCVHPPGKCPEIHCITAQKLLNHIESCNDNVHCQYSRCRRTKPLIHHHTRCRDPSCPVCVPVKLFVQQKGGPRSDSSEHGKYTMKTDQSVVETSEDLTPSFKRVKIEHSSQSIYAESKKQFHEDNQIGETNTPIKSEVTEIKLEIPGPTVSLSPLIDVKIKADVGPVMPADVTGFCKHEPVKTEIDVGPPKLENVELPAETSTSTKSGKASIKGVSMIELFTPEQVREHIHGLRQWVGQSKAKVEKNQALEHSMTENSCQLCAVERLSFEPPPIYCTPCGARIKRNAMFYTVGTGDTRHYICIPCYNDARGVAISVDGVNIPKARFEKKKNDEETEEWWVQCDKCEAWQHQICALFNGRRNDGGQAEYTCPNCYVDEVEKGERNPLPQSALLGAKDLPKTILSDHIETRLFAKLEQERTERAKVLGKTYDEVPGAESLVVRVVSSVDKKLEVKQRFLEIFQNENYPTEFGYKSKVVVLFQKIEGVEVCLFGMYVQEFGAECQQPNHRRVYLSYLDSVKYFRPDIKTVTGEALRTFVYHEILIGYLEYCKLRGFTSCYIWACPPLKGEDYILYCHPEIQKTPKSDKLREWYLSMLKKASNENIVVELTNLYDHFFVSSGECKAKVTAARLPYFDGDYWPGAAEDMIYQLQLEEDGRKQNKKGPLKKPVTKRALKAFGQSQTDLSGNVSKDLLLMRKLGDSISPMKEDFIMVHLQHSCMHCCILMVSGNRWVCNQCKNFQLCDKCYEIEQKLEETERHPYNQRDKHLLCPIEINDVAVDTKDEDEILESEFFDTRQAFLSLCQGNHYQYDTLRRAKHSSMMVLYHLHNPTAPAFVTTCNKCHLDIETGQGWRCDICPDFDVCNSCYYKDGGIQHPHKLTHHPSIAERDAQNKEARQQRVVQLRKMLDLLVHASQCRSPVCEYPNCRKVKGLFRHGINCKTRASGGCALCKKMWYLLQLHARACKESQCHVPRCRDLKEHLRRLQQQSDSRRRVAVMEMMRQRAAEVAGGSR